MQNEIGSDLLDLRDLYERLEALEGKKLEEGEQEELNTLKKLFDDELWDGRDGFDNEPTLIHERYFTQYAEDLAEDIGAIDPNATWPLNRIDWAAAADDLKVDYSTITIAGHTYYRRDY